MDILDRYLGYEGWTLRHMIIRCQELSTEQLHHSFDIGHNTLHETLTHVITNFEMWTDLMAERPVRDLPPLPADAESYLQRVGFFFPHRSVIKPMNASAKHLLHQSVCVAFVILASTLFSCAPVTATINATAPARPFPQHVQYAPNTILPNHRTQAQLDDDIRAFYAEWKRRYLIKLNLSPTRYRIETNPNRTVSEGQGYGMIIVAIMAGHDPEAQAIFDGLWLFVRDHPSHIDSRLMSFEIPEKPDAVDSAFDGDADIAYALLLAHAQWGSEGIFDYQAEAQTMITAILESTIGPESRLPTLGDWVEANGATYNQYTPRSSDFMPAHFRTYGRATNDPVWSTVVANVQSMITTLQATHSPNTGLLPDFIQPISAADHTPRPADPDFLEGPDDGHYYYNAGRDPWRIGADALLNNDATSLAQTQRMADWVASASGQNPLNIKAGYTLDGTPIGNFFTTFFVAPFGVALMTRPSQQTFLNDLYDAVYQTQEGYYEDSVTLLSLLVMTGNYWDPIPQKVAIPLYLPFIQDASEEG